MTESITRMFLAMTDRSRCAALRTMDEPQRLDVLLAVVAHRRDEHRAICARGMERR